MIYSGPEEPASCLQLTPPIKSGINSRAGIRMGCCLFVSRPQLDPPLLFRYAVFSSVSLIRIQDPRLNSSCPTFNSIYWRYIFEIVSINGP